MGKQLTSKGVGALAFAWAALAFQPTTARGSTIDGGVDHSIAVKTDGTVWTWGGNGAGQLGNGTTAKNTTPTQVSGLTAIDAVGAGTQFSVALDDFGACPTKSTSRQPKMNRAKVRISPFSEGVRRP